MQNIYKLIILALLFLSFSCNKETPSTQVDVMSKMIVNKNWYLDYVISSTNTRSYVGQSTYFVTYLKDGTIKDSDGLTGSYTVELINSQSQIHVQVKTTNGNPLEVIYNIISVGDSKMVLSKVEATSTTSQLFFTNK